MSGFQIKVLALVFMFTEHFGRYLPKLLLPKGPLYLEYIGRIVAPLFFFLSVEGFFKTSNRRAYIKRLYVWALIMQIGHFVVSRLVQTIYQPVEFYNVSQNIFLSIAFGISMIAAYEWSKDQTGKRRIGGIALSVLFAVLSLFSESSYIGLACYIVFYKFYDHPKRMHVAYALLSLLLLLWGLTNREFFWEFEFQWMMIAALPFMMLYNGERGRYSLKYFFYLFYPLHIWILYIVGYAAQLNSYYLFGSQ